MGKGQNGMVCHVEATPYETPRQSPEKSTTSVPKNEVNHIQQYDGQGDRDRRGRDNRTGGFQMGGRNNDRDRGSSTHSTDMYFCERHRRYGIRAHICADPGRCRYAEIADPLLVRNPNAEPIEWPGERLRREKMAQRNGGNNPTTNANGPSYVPPQHPAFYTQPQTQMTYQPQEAANYQQPVLTLAPTNSAGYPPAMNMPPPPPNHPPFASNNPPANNGNVGQGSNGRPPTVGCFHCGSTAHFIRECPNRGNNSNRGGYRGRGTTFNYPPPACNGRPN